MQAPKVHIVDTGLMAHPMGAGDERIAGDDQVLEWNDGSIAAIEVKSRATVRQND